MNLFKLIFPLLLLTTAPGLAAAAACENGCLEQSLKHHKTILDGNLYISAKFLEDLFHSKGQFQADQMKFSLAAPDNGELIFLADNPYFIAQGILYNLTLAVRKGPDDFFLPYQPLTAFLHEKYQCSFSDSLTGQISNCSFMASRSNITGISKRDVSNGSIVDIFLSERLAFQPLWVPPHYILNIQKGVLRQDLLPEKTFPGIIRSISSIQEDSVAQITLYMPQSVDTIETAYDDAENRISLLIRKLVKPEPGPEQKPISKLSEKRNKTIIIDPGHGGKDPGAVYKNQREKDITLEVARKLEKRLLKAGYKVLLTRNKDVFIPLQERPKFAAENGGDIFISLHCNAIGGTAKKKKETSGYVAYILREGESEEDKALARRENQAVLATANKNNKDQISPVEWILLEHELNLYSHQSESLAEKIVNAFDKAKIQKHRTGAHQAGFFVLVGTFMPAVLFEMGFITNDTDRNFISSSAGQDEIAERIASGIHGFLSSN